MLWLAIVGALAQSLKGVHEGVTQHRVSSAATRELSAWMVPGKHVKGLTRFSFVGVWQLTRSEQVAVIERVLSATGFMRIGLVHVPVIGETSDDSALLAPEPECTPSPIYSASARITVPHAGLWFASIGFSKIAHVRSKPACGDIREIGEMVPKSRSPY